MKMPTPSLAPFSTSDPSTLVLSCHSAPDISSFAFSPALHPPFDILLEFLFPDLKPFPLQLLFLKVFQAFFPPPPIAVIDLPSLLTKTLFSHNMEFPPLTIPGHFFLFSFSFYKACGPPTVSAERPSCVRAKEYSIFCQFPSSPCLGQKIFFHENPTDGLFSARKSYSLGSRHSGRRLALNKLLDLLSPGIPPLTFPVGVGSFFRCMLFSDSFFCSTYVFFTAPLMEFPLKTPPTGLTWETIFESLLSEFIRLLSFYPLFLVISSSLRQAQYQNPEEMVLPIGKSHPPHHIPFL